MYTNEHKESCISMFKTYLSFIYQDKKIFIYINKHELSDLLAVARHIFLFL